MATQFTRRTALVTGLAAGVAGLTFPAVASAAPAPSTTSGTAFTHMTVVDVTGARPRPDQTVLVQGDRITQLGRSSDVRIPAGMTVVDLRGKYLIPGLSDMHVHSDTDQTSPALYLANGVTTVREMSGTQKNYDWRKRIDAGTLLGPRWVIGSRIVDGSPSLWDPNLLSVVEVTTEDDGRAAVRTLKAEGADFIKVYSRVPKDALYGIADEARRQRIPFVGHCPDNVPIAEAVDLGQRSVEHLFWTPFGISRKEADIRAKIAKIRLGEGDYAGWFAAIHPLEWEAVHSESRVKARQLFAKFAARGTRQVPTLVMHKALDRARELTPNDPRRKYLSKDYWNTQDYVIQELYLNDRKPEDDAQWAAMFDYRLAIVGEMARAGVPIMTGTDTGTPEVFPGFAVHDELQLLVQAGLTPMQALQASTLEPAKFLGLEAIAGTIERGKRADLVILDADPLADIANTQRIHGVVARGRYLDPTTRQKMLDDVIAAAANAPAGTQVAACPCHT
ncbi:MAG: hypothetical protein JWQ81_7966 [Amycolatopsis sp.]|uniref:amidohydrolase family protein n=1 Tax=Amycolatopsis sp. TaxID=37632 RepID=UPI00260A004B|nr:amidohydrolase family protein [Amycolatopsis sp.]MCU1687227.1 hypothetical protein [Amycolatopsis sp.]